MAMSSRASRSSFLGSAEVVDGGDVRSLEWRAEQGQGGQENRPEQHEQQQQQRQQQQQKAIRARRVITMVSAGPCQACFLPLLFCPP